MWTQPDCFAEQMERCHRKVYIVSHTVYVLELIRVSKIFFTGNQIKLRNVRMRKANTPILINVCEPSWLRSFPSEEN